MGKQHWLVKQEPEDYSWENFVADKTTTWTGVRNFQARNNLRSMRKGDLVLFYASSKTKAVIGIATVEREGFPDTTTDEEGWVAVELRAGKTLPRPVTLAEVKADASLQQIALVRQSRLSVMPLPPEAFERILKLAAKR